MTSIEELEHQAAEAAARAGEAVAQLNRARFIEEQARREALEYRRPKMPSVGEPGDTGIIRFTRYTSGKNYSFAAIGWRDGSAVRWVVTGQETRRFTWAALLNFIGEANWPSIELMVPGVRIGPEPGEEPAVAETIGDYGRVVKTESLEPHLGKAGPFQYSGY